MNIWVFILSVAVIVLCLLLFYLYKWYNSSNLISRPLTLQNNTQVISNLTTPNIGTFSISVWIYANTLTKKFIPTAVPNNMIYYFNNISSNQMYHLYFHNNELYFNPSKLISTGITQKLTNIVVNVTRNETFEFFINGKLEQTYIGSSNITYYSDNTSMTVGKCTDDIYITNLQRWAHTRDSGSIWNNYLNGLGFTLPTYNATLTYKQDEKIIQQNSLFNGSYK